MTRAATANGEALNAALIAANLSSLPRADRVVLVPSGYTFTYLPSDTLNGLHDLTVQLDGDIEALRQVNLTIPDAQWPFNTELNKFQNVFSWSDAWNLLVTGSGKVDGHGYEWWYVE